MCIPIRKFGPVTFKVYWPPGPLNTKRYCRPLPCLWDTLIPPLRISDYPTLTTTVSDYKRFTTKISHYQRYTPMISDYPRHPCVMVIAIQLILHRMQENCGLSPFPWKHSNPTVECRLHRSWVNPASSYMSSHNVACTQECPVHSHDIVSFDIFSATHNVRYGQYITPQRTLPASSRDEDTGLIRKLTMEPTGLPSRSTDQYIISLLVCLSPMERLPTALTGLEAQICVFLHSSCNSM